MTGRARRKIDKRMRNTAADVLNEPNINALLPVKIPQIKYGMLVIDKADDPETPISICIKGKNAKLTIAFRINSIVTTIIRIRISRFIKKLLSLSMITSYLN